MAPQAKKVSYTRITTAQHRYYTPLSVVSSLLIPFRCGASLFPSAHK
jgi:hypothetical protein